MNNVPAAMTTQPQPDYSTKARTRAHKERAAFHRPREHGQERLP